MERPVSETELLLLIAAGDEAAFGDLFHRWRDKLYYFILRITNSPETAEDVVQDVFVKLWLNRAELAAVQHFDSWLYTVSRHHAISGMRRMAKETLILAELKQETAQSGAGADAVMLQRELQGKLQAVLRGLPVQQRLVYTMTREQGLKQEEIARRLHISASTVKNHMTMALRTIRRELGPWYHSASVWVVLLACLAHR